MINDNDSFLGRGWCFPPSFPNEGADVEMLSSEENVRQSLELLLQTEKYSRLMHPDFHCDLQVYVFQSKNRQNMSRLRNSISSAILNNEPRVDVIDIDIASSDEQPERLMIKINYLIRSTNSRQNMVFPFYLKEGTNTPPLSGGGI